METLFGDRSLEAQLSTLLNNNICKACNAGTISIAIQEARVYYWNISSLYLHAEFFNGEPDALHHFYTLDTLLQTGTPVLLHGIGERITSELFLSAIAGACKQIGSSSSQLYSDDEAAHYHANQLKRYPLYVQNGMAPMGIFRTVNDFVNLKSIDTPLIFEHIPQPHGDGFNWFYYKRPNGKKGKRVDADDFYAASDGKNLYISWDGSLRKISRNHGEYFLMIPDKMLSGSSDIVARFSLERRMFLPYGGRLPHD